MAARVLLLGRCAASLRATLGASAGGLWLDETPTVADALAMAREGGVELALVSTGDDDAAQLVEDLAEAGATASLPVVVVQGEATFHDAARVLALGARIVPATEPAVRRAIDEALATTAWLAGRRVVVADDDPAITWYLADLLRGEACTVDDALDGSTALERALATTPDLVVADILMPGLDGVRLLRALRADPVLRDVPAVLLSWNDDWLAKARDSGTHAWGYLAKRAEPAVALTCLRSALSARVRLESKMRRGGAVRGVLDDTTPYRLLVLSATSKPDCRISVRDGEGLHEVQLRAGRPVSATRVSMQGAVSRGAPALASLLALRTGRFVVSTEQGQVDSQLDGSLAAQLALQVKKLREGASVEPEGPAWLTVPAAVSFSAPPAEVTLVTEPAPPPAVPVLVADPEPTRTLPLPDVARAAPEAPQQTAPLPTLRLPRARPPMPRATQAPAPPFAYVPAPSPLPFVPAAPPPVPSYAPRRALRASLQTAAVLLVAVVGVATGVGLRAYNLANEAANAPRATGK